MFVVIALLFVSCFASFAHAQRTVWNAYQTPLFSGSYNHAYKIDLPPGTHGLTPNPALLYNSFLAKNAAGWVGAGWEIPLNFIQRDIAETLQDTSDDTFDLILQGAKHDLVYVAPIAVTTPKLRPI